MKEQQHSLNLDECKELGKLEMSKEVVLRLSGMGTLAFFAFTFFFASMHTLFDRIDGYYWTLVTAAISRYSTHISCGSNYSDK